MAQNYVIDGKCKRKAKEIICKECGKKWLIRFDRENSGYCRECLFKGIRNGMYGKQSYNYGEKTYSRNKYNLKRKKEVVSLFSNKCYVCNAENLPLCCYEFHHINKNEKEHQISQMLQWKWSKLEKELQKCIMVCANCHKTITFGGEKLQ